LQFLAPQALNLLRDMGLMNENPGLSSLNRRRDAGAANADVNTVYSEMRWHPKRHFIWRRSAAR